MPNPVVAIPAAASLIGGSMAARGASQAAETQAAAADRTAALQKEMFDLQMKGQEPFRQAGLTSQNRLMELLGLGGDTGAAGYGKYGRDFAMSDYQADPGYAFRLGEGQKALDRQAAARGGLISGGALKADRARPDPQNRRLPAPAQTLVADARNSGCRLLSMGSPIDKQRPPSPKVART